MREETSQDRRDHLPEDITCIRCLQVRPASDLDRLLWCRACRDATRERAQRLGLLAGVAFAALLAAWIGWVVRPVTLAPAVWAVSILAASWLVWRLAREFFYGLERYRNRKARDDRPPPGPGDPGPEEPPS